MSGTQSASKASNEGLFQSVLSNYLVAQARTVEASINRALLGRSLRCDRRPGEHGTLDPAGLVVGEGLCDACAERIGQ